MSGFLRTVSTLGQNFLACLPAIAGMMALAVQKRWSSWSEVRGAAQDRASWRETVAALCASWRDEK